MTDEIVFCLMMLLLNGMAAWGLIPYIVDAYRRTKR